MSQTLLARLPQLLPQAQAWEAGVEAMGLKTGTSGYSFIMTARSLNHCLKTWIHCIKQKLLTSVCNFM